jgi:5'-nucleotidase
MEYVKRFPDLNGNGIPDLPAKYAGPLGRIVSAPSLRPAALLSHASAVTWIAFGAVVLALALVAGLILLIIWLVRKLVRRVSG